MQNIKTKTMSLYPTLESTQEVVELANSKLPITCKNEMYSILMTYHNTLLKEARYGTVKKETS